MDEKLVIEKLKQGDDTCFVEIVDTYKKKILSMCYSYTYDYQEAEDLSQEAFIALYKNIHSFRGDCSLSTYLYRITVSKCLDYKRKRSIKGFLTGMFNIDKAAKIVDLDEKNYIRQCIYELSKDLKTVIVLYFYTGLSQKEIAEVLNVTPKTVEGRIYRAKKKLKKEFLKEEDLLCSKNGII